MENDNFWDVGPHSPLDVEKTWDKFIEINNGLRFDKYLPKTPAIENADYFFGEQEIVLELKEIQTEFLRKKDAQIKYNALIEKLRSDRPLDIDDFINGNKEYPDWFRADFYRLAKPPIDRVLKKANRQIKQTKEYLNFNNKKGVLIFVNDGFTDLNPSIVSDIAKNSLCNSYKSIDCFLYMTMNRYIELPGDNEPKLLWMPSYSESAPDDLVYFIDALGKKWFLFIEDEIGPFTSKIESENRSLIHGAKAINLPSENKVNDEIIEKIKSIK